MDSSSPPFARIKKKLSSEGVVSRGVISAPPEIDNFDSFSADKGSRAGNGEVGTSLDGVKTKLAVFPVTLKNGKEIPVVVSCRADGACVILPRSIKDTIFPKVIKKGEKAEKEVKK